MKNPVLSSNSRPVIDWEATRFWAEGLTPAELCGARADIRKTLRNADALDRADGGCRGGYYRDVASVLHQVQNADRL